MKAFLQEFRTFAVRGNVVDLAVAVVIGAAFGKIVSSLVDNIIFPFTGLLTGGINFSEFTVVIGGASIHYGAFLQSIIDFIIIAAVIFIVVKAMNRFKQKEEDKKTKRASEEVVLLTEIRDLLKGEGKGT